MKQRVQNWLKKYIILNVVPENKIYWSSVIQFSQCDISIHTLIVLNILWYRI
jgi:hypothetical protein